MTIKRTRISERIRDWDLGVCRAGVAGRCGLQRDGLERGRELRDAGPRSGVRRPLLALQVVYGGLLHWTHVLLVTQLLRRLPLERHCRCTQINSEYSKEIHYIYMFDSFCSAFSTLIRESK